MAPDQNTIRVYFKDEVNTCSMYRTFTLLADAMSAIAEHEARNHPDQYRYYTARIV